MTTTRGKVAKETKERAQANYNRVRVVAWDEYERAYIEYERVWDAWKRNDSRRAQVELERAYAEFERVRVEYERAWDAWVRAAGRVRARDERGRGAEVPR